MAFLGYHHIGLRVSDMERSLAFYTEGIGGKVVDSFPMAATGATIYMVELAPGAVVELLPGLNAEEEEKAPRFAHICLLTDDAVAAYQLCLKAGAVSRTEPNTVTRGEMTRTNAFVFGPDKEVIEFYQLH